MNITVGRLKRSKVYRDSADWWIGLYIGPNNLHFCVLTVVWRIPRATSDARARHYSHGGAS
jgi:hypothetical protein